ncbi:hypothetical protein M5K25_020569 [Dendrobium thyrsiflorum]|uniref:Uncharacterized protein n=1 Tax=Dendrobium thyrsiflorum TaxID=117978 RepID=A0ABD0UHA1_DENTH
MVGERVKVRRWLTNRWNLVVVGKNSVSGQKTGESSSVVIEQTEVHRWSSNKQKSNGGQEELWWWSTNGRKSGGGRRTGECPLVVQEQVEVRRWSGKKSGGARRKGGSPKVVNEQAEVRRWSTASQLPNSSLLFLLSSPLLHVKNGGLFLVFWEWHDLLFYLFLFWFSPLLWLWAMANLSSSYPSNPWVSAISDGKNRSFNDVLAGAVSSSSFQMDLVHASFKGVPTLMFYESVVSKLAASFTFTLECDVEEAMEEGEIVIDEIRGQHHGVENGCKNRNVFKNIFVNISNAEDKFSINRFVALFHRRGDSVEVGDLTPDLTPHPE